MMTVKQLFWKGRFITNVGKHLFVCQGNQVCFCFYDYSQWW